MLTVHYSNRLETLAETLAALIREPLASPFASEVVVVQSRGVARWLSLQLAEHIGVCANFHFPFPGAYAWELFRAVLGQVPETSPFDPAVLTWRILQVLPEMEVRPAFAPVRAYVGGNDLRRYELAARLAVLYDQYLVYRPGWIAEWERGRAEHWQAALWQRLAKDAGTPHRARLHDQLLATLAGALPKGAGIPERVSLFGAPALPPSLLALFQGLARHTDVHLFLQNPCAEYWGDIAAARDIARRAAAGKAEARLLEAGNGLLASLGKQGRDFFDLVTETEGVETDERYVDAGEESLLATLQSDILHLRERAAPASISTDDRSLQVHACHSAMREVEVLHDQLLALFAQDPRLQPSDVVVMTPDIETYAPYIDAVFGTAEPRIPFNLSDRSAEHESTLAAAFLALLDLAGSRYEANRVLAILDERAVQRRFGLGESDLDTIQRWMREAGIRWGIDAEHRARFGLPATHEHTWRFGLDRLLLGYAQPAGDERLFEGVLPYDEVEGSLAGVLGRFQSYAEATFALDVQLAGPKTPAHWADLLHGILGRFFDAPDESEHELTALRETIATLQREADAARCSAPVPLAVAKSALRERLEVPGRAFLSGGITFCAMVPMRSLPFEVVCVIGMNDGAFPRLQRPFSFDLMAGDFRKGDRSRRDDDRYLFLESLLAARRCFYVSYRGRDVRDDTVVPPSVLVSELLDHIAEGYHAADGGDVRQQLVTVHPLQPFSRRYFDGGERLFSYSDAMRRAAAALAGRSRTEPQPFFGGALPRPEHETGMVELDALIAFFRHPAKYLLRERLGIRLETAEEELQDREPFEVSGLEAYDLKKRLLDWRLRGEPVDALALARAGGVLPQGGIGEVVFQRESVAIERYADRLKPLLPAETLDPIPIDLPLAHARLTGMLTGVSPAGLLAYRVGNVTVNDRLAAWIRHLVLNALAPAGVARVTRCVGLDGMLSFKPVDDARAGLDALLGLYFRGLLRPLHFFPRTACEYAKTWELTGTVRDTWYDKEFAPNPESRDAYYRLAFRGADPLDDEFEATARVVFHPLNAALDAEPAA
jgi:exodeoxyribonuclease V gamma subunit